MHDPNAPASARLNAADAVLRHGKAASEIEEMAARLAALKPAREARQARRANTEGGVSADGPGSSPIKGHGAKLPRRREAAIIALLTQRNMTEAARVTGVGTPTLYRWTKQAEFAEAFLEARLAAFGRASARLQQASGDAVTTLMNITGDPRTSPGLVVRAANLGLTHGRHASEEDVETNVDLDVSRVVLPVLHADRRTFGEIARKRPRLAA